MRDHGLTIKSWVGGWVEKEIGGLIYGSWYLAGFVVRSLEQGSKGKRGETEVDEEGLCLHCVEQVKV